MATAKVFYLKNAYDGLPKEEDFEIREETLPAIKDGEFLIENLYNSVDPYIRVHGQLKPGKPMTGIAVGKVTENKNSTYPVGSLVVGNFGWRTYAIGNERLAQSPMFSKYNSKLSPSYALGILGLTGFTGYFGLLEICNPQPGETVFVNAAAGATGSTVGQIAKIKGCRVVGCAGSDNKVKYLKELGFDGAFNYKTADIAASLKELCPKGIDCFFDNVGGSMFDTVMTQMNRLGRISLCGGISAYNNDNRKETMKGPYVHSFVIHNELKIQGFMVPTFSAKFENAEKEISSWIEEGKIKAIEHVVEGFENMPKAFISLFTGSNIGKIVVKS